jgi:hypothetical protein
MDEINDLEKRWPSLSLDKIVIKSEDEEIISNPNTTKSEQATLLRKRWKEINTPLIPNADSTMAHYSHLHKALTDKLASAKASEGSQKEFEVLEQTHPLKS